jgi:hypothetical protein
MNAKTQLKPPKVQVTNIKEWATLLHTVGKTKPILTHLNADTTWLVQLPYPSTAPPPPGRTHYNVLIDPWLQGPQSDVASWFSTQWHVVAPSVATMADLNATLKELEAHGADALLDDEDRPDTFIDVVVISHEFTDHCHRATLEELPRYTPVFATDVAADLIRTWDHFFDIVTMPGLEAGKPWTSMRIPDTPLLPSWISMGRVITPGNSLYYHSAVIVAYCQGLGDDSPAADAIVYSPHGIVADDLARLPDSGIRTVALLHGLHDVGIWMTKQLNLGALNGIRAVRASQARYWIATHDEVKTGGGFIAPLLRRTQYTLREAVEHEQDKLADDKVPSYTFDELGSGDGIVLV